MKKTIFFLAALLITTAAFSQTRVRGYYRGNGTYVQSYTRSSRDNTNHNNWSTAGNMNPITGSFGSVARDFSPQATNYGVGHTIHIGPQGGQYYNNSNGDRVYIPKQPDMFVSFPKPSSRIDIAPLPSTSDIYKSLGW